MPFDLRKLVKIGRQVAKSVEELQQQREPQKAGAERAAGGATARKAGELAPGDTVSLYWQAEGEYPGWYWTQHDSSGNVVMPGGRVGDDGEAREDQPEIAQGLFRDHFGFALTWEQPNRAEPRFVGRRPD